MRHHLKAMTVVPLLAVLLLSGCAPTPTPVDAGASAEAVNASLPTADGLMPSVVTLTVNDARTSILASAPNAQIKTVERRDSGKEGLVLEQAPPVGEPIKDTVTLTVSVGSVAVPDVKGMTFGKAKTDLEAAGFTVKEHSVADSTVADGTVVGQNPAPGARNAAEVTLDVARKDAATCLADLKPVETKGSISSGAAEVNGVKYARAVTFELSRGGKTTASYNLGRGFQQFNAVIGISDLASADTSAIIEIQAEDGRQLFITSGEVELGKPVEVKGIDVTGVLRLTISVTEGGNGYSSGREVVLGDACLSNPR